MVKLQLHHIEKSFGDNKIFENLSFTFTKGCYAICGQNGIGKSVLLSMIAGSIKPEKGLIRLDDALDCGHQTYAKKVVYVPSSPSFFPVVRGVEFLALISSIKRDSVSLSTLSEHISGYNLGKDLKHQFGQMSLGTQKKLFLSTLAIGDNSLILLDEPTNALDTDATYFLKSKIEVLSKNSIVIVATHDYEFMRGLDHAMIELKSLPITSFNRVYR